MKGGCVSPDRRRERAIVIDPNAWLLCDPPQRILIVEDDEAVREAIEVLLESEGYVPLSARQGAEALALLRESHELPAVILVDLWMPVMNGWQLCAALAADPLLRLLPIVILTADARNQGNNVPGHVVRRLTKPVDADALLDAVADGVRETSR